MRDEAFLAVQNELSLGERLLWSGRPKPGLMLRSSDVFLIPFSIMWGGFAIFWESSVLASGAPFFFGIWGIPFVVIGLYFMVGRFFVDAWQREKTFYALTNQRVIIVSGLFDRNIKSLSLRTLSDVSLNAKRDGSGTITFGPTHPMGSMYFGAWWPGTRRYTTPGFEMIRDAKNVYERIRTAQGMDDVQKMVGKQVR